MNKPIVGVIPSPMPSRNGNGAEPPLPNCQRCGGAFKGNREWAWGPAGTVVHADPSLCQDFADQQRESAEDR